jgi:hypothetical protein
MNKTSKNIIKVIWAGVVILTNAFQVSAQQAGEVKDQEFVIRKDRVLTLPTQPRKFERTPVLPVPKSDGRFDYTVNPYFLSLAPEVMQPEAAQKQWPRKRQDLYPGFARLGFGNYSSPLFEGRFNNWEEGDYNYGVKVKHEGFYTGPVEGRNSAENFTDVGLNGTLFRDFFQVYGGVDYYRHKFNFYGYDFENPALENFIPNQNILNTFKLHAGIQDLDRMEGFNYDVNLGMRAFNDRYEAAETELALKIKSGFWFEDYLKTAIDLDLSLTRPRDEFYSDISRNYFKVNPYVAYQNEALKVRAGANVVFENDVTQNKTSDFQVFPQVIGEYMIQDEFGVYAGFEGDVHRKTYQDFVLENPFLGPSERLLNTIQNYEVKAGVKGVLNQELTYELGFGYGRFRNMHFFANSGIDSTRFNIFYDDDTRVLNYQAKVGWEYEGWYRLLAKANYFFYNTSTLEAAFQRPEWELSLNNNFILDEKWLIQFNANVMGGIVAGIFDPLRPEAELESTAFRSEVLPVIIDLQLKADYQINDQFSVFAVGNNLLNRKNQRFLNYPVRGIQGIVGLTYKFGY